MIAVEMSTSLQQMIDARLDSVERALMLKGMERGDRRQIVSAIEDQIMEMLNQSVAEEPTRDDVLSVLSKLDPPEAYLELADVGTASIAPKSRERRPVEHAIHPARTNSFNTLAIIGLILAIIACLASVSWWLLGFIGLVFLALVTIASSICSTIAFCQFVFNRNGQRGLWMAVVASACTPAIAVLSWLTYFIVDFM